MKYLLQPAALALAATALLATASLPARAASSAASSASDSVSTSVGSVSDSIQGSSDSSSKKKDVAAGDYKVIEMAAAPNRPGMVQLKLLAVNEQNLDNAFFLTVPERVAEEGRLAAGQVVAARTRPYGMEFAKADNGQAFFLVLHDEWYRELRTTAVVL